MPQNKWTVMVYMAAGDTLKLDANAVRDIVEMEHATFGDELDVVVQINRSWPKQPQRYRVSRVGSRLEMANVRDENMGSGETLLHFLQWAAAGYPADCYFLILWGHAYGLGFGRDHGDPLKLNELHRALDAFQSQRGKPLDLLGCNACAMSYLEAAFELKDCVSHLVASQISVPFAGWPYDSILTRIPDDPTPVGVGTMIIDRYVNDVSDSSEDRLALTLLDLSKAGRLRDLLTNLTTALDEVVRERIGSAVDRLSQVRTAFLATVAGDVRPLVDAVDLCDELTSLCQDLRALEAGRSRTSREKETPLDRLEVAAGDLSAALQKGPGQFVVAHRCHPELTDLNGVGIFAPFIASLQDLTRLGLAEDGSVHGRAEYAALGLVKGTGWDTLVYDTLRAGLPTDIEVSIDASASDRQDRAAATQMLGSVDSMFLRLDRTLSATQLLMARAMTPKPPARGAMATASAPGPFDIVAQFGRLRLFAPDMQDLLLKAGKDSTAAPPPVSTPPTGPIGEKRKQKQKPTQTPPKTEVDTGAVIDSVDALESLEKVLAQVERAVQNTLTNGTFGLGPGVVPFSSAPAFGLGASRDVSLDPKSGLGLDPKSGLGLDPKSGMGLDPKSGMGLDPKSGMGDESALSSFSVRSSNPAAAVGILFGQVGQSLRDLEQAAEDVVSVTATALAGLLASAGVANAEAQQISLQRIERHFKVLGDASTDARRTLRRVLAHPAYGFGRGPASIGAEDRRELARAGGLNSRVLRLL